MRFGTESSPNGNSFLRRVEVERHAISVTRSRFPEVPRLDGLTSHAISCWEATAEIRYGAEAVANAAKCLRTISDACGLLADGSMQVFRAPDEETRVRIACMLREFTEE